MTTIYVLILDTGEYSQRSVSVLGVYDSQANAEMAAMIDLRNSNAYNTAHMQRFTPYKLGTWEPDELWDGGWVSDRCWTASAGDHDGTYRIEQYELNRSPAALVTVRWA